MNCKVLLLAKKMIQPKKKPLPICVPAVAVIREGLALSIIIGCKTFGGGIHGC